MDETQDEGGESPFSSMDPETAANPQPMFKMLRDSMPVMPVEGMGVVVTRKVEVDEVFRHPEIFSSNADAVDLKNKRPMIPLQIDPPEHKKYRKILDPIFAPRQMALIEDSVAATVNGLIDGFIDRGEIDFAAEFSMPFPSQVFLTLFGLPYEELPRFLKMKDGVIRPDVVTGSRFNSAAANAYQQETADSIYDYFNEILDLREEKREADILSRFLDAEVDGEKLTREDILDICFLFLIAGLDTVTATLDCMFAYLAAHPDQRQQIVDDPAIIPAAIEELLRWETPVMAVARVAVADTETGRVPDPQGGQRHGHDRLGQHRRGRSARRRRGPLRPRGQPPRGLRRRRPPLPRIPPGPPGAAGGPPRVAPAHPRVLGGRGPRAPVHRRHPLHRLLPDGDLPAGS